MKVPTRTTGRTCPRRARVLRVLLDDRGDAGHTLRVPYGVAAHLSRCPSCRRLADDVGQVTGALSDLRTQTQSWDLLGRANTHALRMLRRVVRSSEQAQRLSHPEKEPTIIPLVRLPIRRLGTSAAAALILVCFRAGWLNTWDEGRILAEKLAQVHLERHVIPDQQEWA